MLVNFFFCFVNAHKGAMSQAEPLPPEPVDDRDSPVVPGATCKAPPAQPPVDLLRAESCEFQDCRDHWLFVYHGWPLIPTHTC